MPTHNTASRRTLKSVDTVGALRHAATAESLTALSPKSALLPWLHLTTSLTAHLAAEFDTYPGLILLGEGLESGQRWELAALNTAGVVFARHIALTVNDTPVVLARTVTPPGPGMNALTELQTRPLAELLFEDPQWQRDTAVQYLCLEDGAPGRGCHWYNNRLEAGLLVQEFFLPELNALLSR